MYLPAVFLQAFFVTSDDVENVVVEFKMRAKPVMAVAAMGLVPTSPFTEVMLVVLTPVLDRMAKSSAMPRMTSFTALVPKRLNVSRSGPRESMADSNVGL